MSDPIDREQALSAFDTDDNKLVIRGSENADAVEQYLKKVMGKIENLPSAQPEIIRCKDCDYGVVDDPQIPFLRFCKYSGQDWNDENHYCGHAKRRNNAELD